MHIGMWTDSYYPYVSGVTRAIATSREALVRLGNKVSVFCPKYPGADSEPDIYRFPSFRAPTNKDYYVAVPFYPQILSKVPSMHLDVMHIHSPFNLSRVGLKMGKKLGIPVVFTYHTMYNMYSHYVPIIGSKASEVVMRGVLAFAEGVDCVITPSTAIKEFLLQRGLNTEIRVIPNGIDVSSFQSGNPSYLRERFAIPGGSKVILSCSRLGREKNVETVLRAFAIVARRPDVYLVLVGDGPLREDLEQLSQDLGIRKRTIFAGTVPPSTMPDVYASADLFLFASLTDTQGLVIIEAKAAGLPAVAVGALGVKDMIVDGVDGYLCNNDPSELAEKSSALLDDDSLLADMKSASRKNALSFSREECAKKLFACYQELISRSS